MIVSDCRVKQVEQSHLAQTRSGSESLKGQVAGFGGGCDVPEKKTALGFSDQAFGKTVGQLWAG